MVNPTIRSEPSGCTLQTVTTKAVRRRRWSSPALHLRGRAEPSRLLEAFRHRSLRGCGYDEGETTVAQGSWISTCSLLEVSMNALMIVPCSAQLQAFVSCSIISGCTKDRIISPADACSTTRFLVGKRSMVSEQRVSQLQVFYPRESHSCSRSKSSVPLTCAM